MIIGASLKPQRMSNRVIRLLAKMEIPTVAIGRTKGQIGKIRIEDQLTKHSRVDIVSLYIRPELQATYYDYLLQTIHPKRVIFNPGSENEEFSDLLSRSGITVENACTLVLLQTGQFTD